MADSKRQLIINAVDTRFKTILVSGGYETDLGQNVFEWRTAALPVANLPGIVLRDPECSVSSDVAIGQHEYELKVEAEINVAEGSSTPGEIRKMIADVIKAIGVDITWGGLAQRTEPIEDTINMDQKEKIIGGALVSFLIIYRTNAWNAYT